MEGASEPSRTPVTLYKFNSRDDMQHYAIGCDADVGGSSTVHFDLDEDPERNREIGKPASARFWGEMRLGVRSGLEGRIRGGYAGFRNKVRVAVGCRSR